MCCTEAINRRSVVENNKMVERKSPTILLFVGIFIISFLTLFMLSNFQVYAAGESLTDMFQTKSFRGSSEALSKANWIGMALHYIISWFSFLGLCLTLYQKFITLLYLSARNLFNNIDDIKTNQMKGGPLGFKGLFEVVKTGEGSKTGGGFDVFITFVYGMLPNIKAYSDYADDKVRGYSKLNEEDGPTQYMLKTAIPTIMLVFFLTIGYSGTLGKAYGFAVAGMATAADTLVSKNLSAFVKKLTISGEAYQFSIAARGDRSSELAEKIAREVYHSILSVTDNPGQEFHQRVGQKVEQTIINLMNGNSGVPIGSVTAGSRETWDNTLLTKAKNNSADPSMFPEALTQDMFKSLKYRPFLNRLPEAINPDGEFTINLDEIVEEAMKSSSGTAYQSRSSDPRVVHILIQYDANTNANYQEIIVDPQQYDGQNLAE